MPSDDRYFTTRALDWIGTATRRAVDWIFDEQRNYKRMNFILCFIAGAVVMRIAPEIFEYAGIAAGWLLISAFALSFLLPIAYLIEWALRRLFRA
jgi:hypothetical protein